MIRLVERWRARRKQRDREKNAWRYEYSRSFNWTIEVFPSGDGWEARAKAGPSDYELERRRRGDYRGHPSGYNYRLWDNSHIGAPRFRSSESVSRGEAELEVRRLIGEWRNRESNTETISVRGDDL